MAATTMTLETGDVIADLKSGAGVPTDPKTARYHVGIYEHNPPAWFTLLAGVTFPVTSSTFDPEDREVKRAGSFVELSLDQVKKVKSRLMDHIVRWRRHPRTQKPIEASLYDRTVPGFLPEKGDEPLARYVYFKKAPPETDAPRLAENTLAMIDQAIREAEASEEAALRDPEDARIRESHGNAKRTGKKAGADQLEV